MSTSKGLLAGSIIGVAAAAAALMSMPESAPLRRSMKRKAKRLVGNTITWLPAK